MRKTRKIMIALFCAGIVLTGIGSGIAFSEFTSFTYIGQKETGQLDKKTTTLDYTFEPSESDKLSIMGLRRQIRSNADITVSEQIPDNTVRFLVTYNAKAVEPHLYSSENEYVGLDYYYISDDFGNFMERKDEVLKGLKNREISSYTTTTIEDVKVLVNAATKSYINIE